MKPDHMWQATLKICDWRATIAGSYELVDAHGVLTTDTGEVWALFFHWRDEWAMELIPFGQTSYRGRRKEWQGQDLPEAVGDLEPRGVGDPQESFAEGDRAWTERFIRHILSERRPDLRLDVRWV